MATVCMLVAQYGFLLTISIFYGSAKPDKNDGIHPNALGSFCKHFLLGLILRTQVTNYSPRTWTQHRSIIGTRFLAHIVEPLPL
uniref:Uncharacterized protein n=1 Tax=Anguilla anguilla TaxID=7936 RepID=A0A0E9QBM1_ANGAN